MSAVADLQNTVVKEFENDSRVVTAVMSQAESRPTLETFWRNVYLRGQMLFDPNGAVAGQTYGQPYTGLPFGRAFIIGPDQTVELPLFGHDPRTVIQTLHDMLGDPRPPGDVDGDRDVDLDDVGLFASVLVGRFTNPDWVGRCDVNGDERTDGGDVQPFLLSIASALD